MGAHGIFGGGAVACLQGGKHGQVLCQALLQPARRMQLLQAGQPQNLAQITNRLGQPAVVGQRDEGFVNGVVGGVVVGDTAFAGALLQAGLVDELIVYIAPKLLGSDARGLCTLPGLEKLADAPQFKFKEIRHVGPDVCLHLVGA